MQDSSRSQERRRRSRRVVAAASIGAACLLGALPSVAAGVGDGGRAVGAGPATSAHPVAPRSQRPVILPVAMDRELVHLGSEVTVTVDGRNRVARYEIQEEFRNVGGRLMEGDYLYPVPAGAVFTDLSLFMGETELRGEMLPADRARDIYEDIVRQRKDPALVELVGSGLIRARVFPIEPGQTRKIILRYTQILPRDGDIVRLTYPRTRSALVPRLPAEGVQPWNPPPHPPGGPARPATPGLELSVRVTGAARFGAPVSPSHTIDWQRPVADELEIRAGDTGGAAFELLLPLLRDEIGASVLVHSPDPGREEGYFLMLVTPPPYQGGERIPRDLTLVLDLSGSMSGHKHTQATAALRRMLRGLDRDDRFRLITFASVVREWREGWASAGRETIDEAVAWLDRQQPDGSTNIDGALQRALETPADPARLSLVLFLTDGLPTIGETDPERIATAAGRLRDGERVFAFGVGEDVNTYLLDRLAEGGRGAVSYVAPGEDVEAAIGALAVKVGTPALADLRIVEAPVSLEDRYPAPLPDLFHGEELMLLGRYRGAGAGRLVLEGSRRGEAVRLSFDLEFARRESGNDYIARLWASRKAGALTAHLRLHGPDDETIEAIRQLGLRYGILTPYTSYLVEEPEMRHVDVVSSIRQMAVTPGEQTGRVAFEQARADAGLRAARSISEAEEAMAAPAPVAEPTPGVRNAGGMTPTWLRVGRRIFNRDQEVWRDARVESDDPEIAIAPWSEAWFDLLERFPGLRTVAALGPSVIIAGEDLTLRLDTAGAERLDAAAWQRIERAFAAER